MASTLESLKNGWRNLKEITKKIIRALPAAGKVAGMTGNVPFFGAKLVRWIWKLDASVDPLNTTQGLVIACVGSFGVCTTSIITRGLNMYRQETARAAVRAGTISDQENQQAIHPNHNEIVANATFCHIGHSNNFQGLYKASQFFSLLYMITSASGGYVSGFSLANLFSKITSLEFDSTCTEKQSHLSTIVAVHAAAAFLSYTSITSFRKYNLKRIREYYWDFIEEERLKNIRLKSWAVCLTGVTINTVGIVFANKHMYEMFAKNSLCHLGKDEIPNYLINILVITSAVTNFIVTTMMTLPAVHRRHNLEQSTEISDLLSNLPTFKKLDWFINLNFFIDYLFTGAATTLSVSLFPQTALDEDLGDYNWIMITGGIILGLIAFIIQRAMDREAYGKELEAQSIEAGIALPPSPTSRTGSLQEPLVVTEMAGTRSLSSDLSESLIPTNDDLTDRVDRRIGSFEIETLNLEPQQNGYVELNLDMLDPPSTPASFARNR